MSFAVAHAIDRRRTLRAGVAVVFLAVAVLLWGGYHLDWTWTGLTSNATLWAWLKLLALPLSLAALPLWLRDHHRMSTRRRLFLTAATVALVLLVVLGYALDWRWTGFAGNTLWDWLEVLVLPATIVTIKFWTAERSVETRHRVAAAVLVIGFAVFAASAYLMPIDWTGFVGNTLWDWVRLLFIPLLMPLVLVPAVTNWVSGGTVQDQPEPEQVTTYEVWLSPEQKVTAQVVQPNQDGAAPQLVVTGAHAVELVSATG